MFVTIMMYMFNTVCLNMTATRRKVIQQTVWVRHNKIDYGT